MGRSHRFSISRGSHKTQRPVCVHIAHLCEREFTMWPIPIGNAITHLDQGNGSQLGIFHLKYSRGIPLLDDLAPYSIIAVA